MKRFLRGSKELTLLSHLGTRHRGEVQLLNSPSGEGGKEFPDNS